MAELRRLDPLPPSDDKFWDLAETNLHDMGRSDQHIHKFVRTTGIEAECIKCGAGIIITELTKGLDKLVSRPAR